MSDRGATEDCTQYFNGLTASYKEIADKCDVDQSSLRKFRSGGVVIRRTTFNKIREGLKSHFDVDVPANRFREVDDS